MDFSVDAMMEHSFVMVKDEAEYGLFCSRMGNAGFDALPKKYLGLYPRGLMQCDAERVPMVACALSHFVMVNMALAMDWPCVTIFEADAYPMNRCRDELDRLFSESGVPDDADLLTLGNLHFVREYDNGGNDLCLYDVRNGYGRIKKDLWGAHAVIVFARGDETWLKNFRGHNNEFHADYFNQLAPMSYSTDRSYFIQVKERLEYPHWLRDRQYLCDFPDIKV